MTMHRVVGLDLSLTATGLAIITRRVNGGCIANVTTIKTRGKRDDQLPQRRARMLGIAHQIAQHSAGADYAVVEAPSFGSQGGSPVDRYGLWWHAVGHLLDTHTPVATCAPLTLKKWATGKAKDVDKAAVSVAVSRLWPDVELGNADEGDALALATMGAQHLGWDVTTLTRHTGCLASVKWPEGLSPVPTTGEVA